MVQNLVRPRRVRAGPRRLPPPPEPEARLRWLLNRGRSHREIIPGATGAVFVILILVFVRGCGSRARNTVPDELVGVWKTSTPGYTDRYLELRKQMVIFGMGSSSISINPIVKMEEVRKENTDLYVIQYVGDGNKTYSLAFYYSPSNGGRIRLKNQIQIEWIKGG